MLELPETNVASVKVSVLEIEALSFSSGTTFVHNRELSRVAVGLK